MKVALSGATDVIGNGLSSTVAELTEAAAGVTYMVGYLAGAAV
jgi:hypothetical protein